MEGLVDELAEFAEVKLRDPQTDQSPPHELAHLWELYLDVQSWRGFDANVGRERILAIDVLANWATATGRRFAPFELEVLSRLDGAYWDAMAKGPMQKADPLAALKAIAKQDGKIRTIKVNPKKA